MILLLIKLIYDLPKWKRFNILHIYLMILE